MSAVDEQARGAVSLRYGEHRERDVGPALAGLSHSTARGPLPTAGTGARGTSRGPAGVGSTPQREGSPPPQGAAHAPASRHPAATPAACRAPPHRPSTAWPVAGCHARTPGRTRLQRPLVPLLRVAGNTQKRKWQLVLLLLRLPDVAGQAPHGGRDQLLPRVLRRHRVRVRLRLPDVQGVAAGEVLGVPRHVVADCLSGLELHARLRHRRIGSLDAPEVQARRLHRLVAGQRRKVRPRTPAVRQALQRPPPPRVAGRRRAAEAGRRRQSLHARLREEEPVSGRAPAPHQRPEGSGGGGGGGLSFLAPSFFWS
eukprot:Rhum_TRINITY_DN15319_c4_g3::Rhum_TRINITY_DN15319_c4_g3_i1::g.150705::m.150705